MRLAAWLLLWLLVPTQAYGDPPGLPPPCTADAFPDVPASSPFCRWIRDGNRQWLRRRLGLRKVSGLVLFLLGQIQSRAYIPWH